MNKIDFKNIRNQFESMIQIFDKHKISNQKIFSAVFDLNFNFEYILGDILSNYNPIFFSSANFVAFNLINEHNFLFSKEDNFKIKENEIMEIISGTVFINPNQDYKTFIFGGFNFDLNEVNNNIWNGVPIGDFTLPRYTFIDSKLIINFFTENKTTKLKIEKMVFKYIDDLEQILFTPQQNTIKSQLLKISDLTSRDAYYSKVNDLLKNLKKYDSELIKVVFSRIKKVSFSDKVPLISLFKKLLYRHSQNMNFLYTIKDNISIIGSTPELILSVLNGQIRSESIAGSNYTHKTNEFILDKKEIIEQKIVTQYIVDFFNQNAKDISYNEKPYIKKSSDIEHLCTSISGKLDTDKNIFNLLKNLHPTPAIGGFPKNEALSLIKTENEDRGRYGGPIGWIDNNLEGEFFLNIRSGLGFDSNLYLFSGSGIIKESICENEWMETEQKFNLMLNACNE